MSYCVNCGVELDATAVACPLCNTKIYHPEQPPAKDLPTPYPTIKGKPETVKNTEFTILMTIILLTTSIVCVLLNFFTLQVGRWSVYVCGVCAMLWIFFMPVFFPQKFTAYVHIALDGLMISLFLAMISWFHPYNNWFENIALPIVLLSTLLLEILFIFFIRLKSSLLVKTAMCIISIGIICASLEMVIDLHLRGTFYLGWSAIVLICCAAIDLILMTIRLRSGLRSEIRRRMHF